MQDLAALPAAQEFEADLCIVGAGPAGITIARELLGSGLSVCIVESGGLNEDAETHALYDGDTIGHLVRMLDGRHRTFGGSATRWGGRCAMLDPLDFEQRDWVPNSGWPFSYADFLPFYERAKTISNFSGTWIDDDKACRALRAAPYPFTSGKLQRMVWRVASPDLSATLRTRLRLGYRTAFDYGRAYRTMLVASSTTRVVLNANLTAFQMSVDGEKVTSITVSTLDGNESVVRAKAFVLCCGGTENARLLLNAPQSLRDRANSNDNVGRFLNQHPRGSIGHIAATHRQARRMQRSFNNYLRPRRVPVQYEIGFALSEDAQQKYQLVNASAAMIYEADEGSAWKAGRRLAYALKRRKLHSGAWRDIALLVRGAPSIAINVVRRYCLGREPYHPSCNISVDLDLEQAPIRESRIVLSQRRDRFGNRLARADWRISPIERKTAHFFAEALDAEFRQMDLGRLEMKPWLTNDDPLTEHDLAGNYHFIGTTRMANSPKDGVVDANCRIHGIENLYIAGASVFPTGGHANPTLTIVALSIRLADHIKVILKNNDPSIDRSTCS